MSFGQGGPRWGEGEGRRERDPGADPHRQGPYGPAYGPVAGSPGQPPSQPLPPEVPVPDRFAPQPPQTPQTPQPPPQQAPWQQQSAAAPDWAALADASAAHGRRRRRLLIGGGVLATCAVAAIVATAVVVAGNGHRADRATEQSPTPSAPDTAPPVESVSPQPSFSAVDPAPPPDPKDFIDSAAKDKAPLSAGTLFPGARLTIGGRVYVKAATASTGTCATATQGGLGPSLTAHGCDRVIRATYTRNGVAVTVGVAVFDGEARALAVKRQTPSGGIASLPGAGVPTFCHGVVCRTTTNSYGRYAYFTMGGFTAGRGVTAHDRDVYRAGDDLAQFAFSQIVARGRAQASAAEGR